jgi:hypothetical protein
LVSGSSKIFKKASRRFKASSKRNRKLFLQSFGRLFCKPKRMGRTSKEAETKIPDF